MVNFCFKYPGLSMIGLLFLLIAVSGVNAQEEIPINLGQTVEGTVTPSNPSVVFTVDLNRRDKIEALFDIPDRESPITLSVFNVLNDLAAQNDGINYPDFAGAYLIYQIGGSGTHTFRIDLPQLAQPLDYSFRVRKLGADEPDRTIQIRESKTGLIESADDFDIFRVYLRAGNPVLFVLRNPSNVLDSVMGIFDPSGQIVAVNDDFFSSASVLLYMPEQTGTYVVLVQGAIETAIGPYELAAKEVPIFSPPFNTTENVDSPGDVFAYEMVLFKDTVYQFDTVGVDGFLPFVALSDVNMNVISSNTVESADVPLAGIPGFTPLHDESLYLLVAGDTPDMTGGLGVEVTTPEDESNLTELEHGDFLAGVIGPIGDMDQYSFSAEEGKEYSILITPTWHILDPAFRVLNINGEEVLSNDNASGGVQSLLSGFQLPEGDYKIEVFASPTQEIAERLTGVYVIQFVEGTTFDRSEPLIFEPEIEVSPIAGGVHIHIPTSAVSDDTYPLSATMTFETDHPDHTFEIQKGLPVEFDLPVEQDEIAFLTISDSAHFVNTTMQITLPPPHVISPLGGMPYGLAVAKDNTLYITESENGAIVKVMIDGATETVVTGEPTGGGTLGPNALAFDHHEDLFMTNARTHSVVKIHPDGATEAVVAELNFPIDLAFDQDNNMIIVQLGADNILKVHADGSREVLASDLRNPNNVAISPDGQIYFCTSNRENGSGIYRISEDGTVETVMEPFADSLQGMAFDREGYLYIADGISGFLYRISPENEFQIFTRWLSGPVDVAFGRGEYGKTLFATNMGIEANGFYFQNVVAIKTGREGLLLPFGSTGILDWLNW